MISDYIFNNFMQRVVISNHYYNDTPCWEWSGTKDMEGYSQLYCQGKYVKAHRYSYQYFVEQIPYGLTIDHLCRNKQCVNAEHLEAVTLQINISRAKSTHCPHGHEYTKENIIIYPSEKYRRCRTCLQIKKQHGVENVI